MNSNTNRANYKPNSRGGRGGAKNNSAINVNTYESEKKSDTNINSSQSSNKILVQNKENTEVKRNENKIFDSSKSKKYKPIMEDLPSLEDLNKSKVSDFVESVSEKSSVHDKPDSPRKNDLEINNIKYINDKGKFFYNLIFYI